MGGTVLHADNRMYIMLSRSKLMYVVLTVSGLISLYYYEQQIVISAYITPVAPFTNMV